jgi:putative sterol carrier protein
MKPVDIFDKTAERFVANKAVDLTMTVGFDLDGEDGGQWHVIVDKGECEVNQGAADSANAVIKMTDSDYVDMMTGKLNPMMAFMSGKVKVEGDLNSVMKFQSIFGM